MCDHVIPEGFCERLRETLGGHFESDSDAADDRFTIILTAPATDTEIEAEVNRYYGSFGFGIEHMGGDVFLARKEDIALTICVSNLSHFKRPKIRGNVRMAPQV
jgi:hypothetical protein